MPNFPDILILSPLEALNYFRGLVPSLSLNPADFLHNGYRTAFALAVATEENLLQKVKDVIQEALQTGQEVGSTPKQVQAHNPA